MASSNAATVEAYLAELPPERSAVISAVREVLLGSLPEGYEERMNWGMICYEVPLSTYPDTYNKQPLAYLALAAQKHYYALYLSCDDRGQRERLREAFEASGKKMDMGKSCLRFRHFEDLPVDVIGEIVAATPPAALIAAAEAARTR